MKAADPSGAVDLVRRRELLRRLADIDAELRLVHALRLDEFGDVGERVALRALHAAHVARLRISDEIRGSRAPVAPSIRPVPTWSRP